MLYTAVMCTRTVKSWERWYCCIVANKIVLNDCKYVYYTYLVGNIGENVKTMFFCLNRSNLQYINNFFITLRTIATGIY